MKMNRSNDPNRPLAVFFVLTFAISWGAILLIFGPEVIPATPAVQQQIGMAILLGPALAGLSLTVRYDGVKGLQQLGKKLLRWRVGLKWYAVAILTAPISTLICIFILSFSSTAYHPAISNSTEASGLLALGIIGGLVIGLFEELGWTGFAVPRLSRKRNIYFGGMIVGILWGAWHFILFWEDDSFHQPLAFFLLLARLFAWLPAYRILMVWVYENTQSLLIIILMHASLVASLATLDPIIHGEELLIYIVIRALVLWILVAILMIFRSRSKRINRSA